MATLVNYTCKIFIKMTPVNGFLVSFSSLQNDSDEKTVRLASKRVFPQNFGA